jgi:hypothetical protein
MYGMDDTTSSLMYGYPICMCCWLPRSTVRDEIHRQRLVAGLSAIRMEDDR